MNEYTRCLSRIEFVVTWACTGRCRHCSEGDHTVCGVFLEPGAAETVVRRIASRFSVDSVMTFGGEPLLCPDTVAQVHAAARDCGVPKRQLITNGFFSRDEAVIRSVAKRLSGHGVNDILLSADAFHQETIPLKPVMTFAEAILSEGVALRVSPAWLVSPDADNPWNSKTREVLSRFTDMGVRIGDGNIIFPAGNALIHLAEYFDPANPPENPYEEDPRDIRAVSVSPNGDMLGGNVYRTDVLDIIEGYRP